MTPEQVAESYDRIADRWSRSTFDRSNGIRQHELAIRFAAGRGSALDVGCGCNGRIIDVFLSHGFKPEGLDYSAEMLRLARNRHPDIWFYQANVCSWVLPHLFDLISAWDSIWHVPLQQQQALLLKLFAGLTAGGVMIFSAGGTEAPDERRDDAMGVPMYHATLGVRAIVDLVHRSGCVLRHFEYDQYPLLHAFFVVLRPLPSASAAPMPLT